MYSDEPAILVPIYIGSPLLGLELGEKVPRVLRGKGRRGARVNLGGVVVAAASCVSPV
jgi:hypothetical protein